MSVVLTFVGVIMWWAVCMFAEVRDWVRDMRPLFLGGLLVVIFMLALP